jgi:hypothetical protein
MISRSHGNIIKFPDRESGTSVGGAGRLRHTDDTFVLCMLWAIVLAFSVSVGTILWLIGEAIAKSP